MKILKKSLLILSLFILIISCSKDDEQVQTPKTPSTLLSKINYSSTSSYTKFSYDENNKLILEERASGNGNVCNTTFVYNTKGKITETLKKPTAGNITKIEKQSYYYDSQDRLVEKKSFLATINLPNDFALDYSEMYSYSGNNIEYIRKDAGNNYLSTRLIIELDQNGNYTSVKTYKNMTTTDPIGV